MGKVELLNNYGVEVEQALDFWGDISSYEESLKEFKDSCSDKLTNLEFYKNNSDWENYGILAHSTKSEAKYLGFMKDAEIFLQHEMAGKEKNGEFILNHFEELKDGLIRIDALLAEYFSSTDNEIKNILIADDSNIMLNFLEHTIGNDYHVIKASNGKEAIEKIESMNIYALLLDLNMPKANGFEVLDYLKEHDLIDKLPVIVVTGDDSEDTIKKAFTYPILDVLNKPFKEENIKRILVSIKNFYSKN